MRIEGVGLEDHGEAALGRGDLVDHLAVDEDFAGGNLLQAGDHAEQRRFPAARRADEDDELAVLDGKVDAVDHLDGAEVLHHAAELEGSPSRHLHAIAREASPHRGDGRGRSEARPRWPVRAE